MVWEDLLFNAQNIVTATSSAYLIKMPKGSRYSGYMFWHPAKLIREAGGKGQFIAMSYTDDFEFKLFKNGKGKYNKSNIVDRKVLSAKDIEEAFEVFHQAVSDAIEANENKPKGIPVLRPPQEVEVDESLRDEN